MCGEGLKFDGDNRVWRVLQITKNKLKILFDFRNQPKFQWVNKSELNFSQMHWIEWPVFDIDGVAEAVRHTNFAPDDLFLDDRGERPLVRQLSDQERWNIMSSSVQKAKVLKESGMEGELGQLDRNSIPRRMADLVADEAASRVARYKLMVEARSSSGFILMSPSAGLHSPKLCATFLIVLALNTGIHFLCTCAQCAHVHNVHMKKSIGKRARFFSIQSQ